MLKQFQSQGLLYMKYFHVEADRDGRHLGFSLRYAYLSLSPRKALTALCFQSVIRLTASQVLFARLEKRAGKRYSSACGRKISRPFGLYFSFTGTNTALFPRHAWQVTSEQTSIAIRRISVLKKYRLMTKTVRHNSETSFTSSPAHTAYRRVLKVVVMIVLSVVGLLLWAILKPMLRGAGWLISIATATAIIFWLMTL